MIRTGSAAAHRAVHQILEQGCIFTDPLALSILDEDAAALVEEAEKDPSQRRMRLFIAVRTRFAEDALSSAVERGVRQCWELVWIHTRTAAHSIVCVFLNGPSGHARLETPAARGCGYPLPDWLTFAPVDFEHETLPEGLAEARFDAAQQTFFTWLGVVPYLIKEAVWSTLGFIASLPNGAHVVFDYSDPPDSLSPAARILYDKRAAHVGTLGEAWVNHFEAEPLRAELTASASARSRIWDRRKYPHGTFQIASALLPKKAASPARSDDSKVTHVSG